VLNSEIESTYVFVSICSFTFAYSLKFKAVYIRIIDLILIMLLISDLEKILKASSWIFRFSTSRRDKAPTTADVSFFSGRYSDVTPYSSRSKCKLINVKNELKRLLLKIEVIVLTLCNDFNRVIGNLAEYSCIHCRIL
jgi:hypothetical protein